MTMTQDEQLRRGFNLKEYYQARRMHALWLRRNGLLLRQVAERLGVSGDRARTLIWVAISKEKGVYRSSWDIMDIVKSLNEKAALVKKNG